MSNKKEYKKNGRLKFERGIDIINKVSNEPEPNFLWHGIPEGSKGLITGAPKTGKTTMAENLAMSMSVGKKDFLGFQLEGKPRKVLFVNMEESYKLHGRRNKKQIYQLSDDELKLFKKNYLCAPRDFPEFLNSEDDWIKLRECIKDSKAEVVFIDSLTHMFDGEIEKTAPAKRFVEKFRDALKDLDVTVIVIHHNTKGNGEPMTQDKIAGSRVILQEFEFAYGLANIPSRKGGNYLCMLNNKHIAKDDTKATIYKLNEYGWVEYVGVDNKYNLYKEESRDGRTNTANLEIIYEYIKSQTSQTSQIITTAVLNEEFVQNNTMSKDTLHKSLNKLEKEGRIVKESHGNYKLMEGGRNE